MTRILASIAVPQATFSTADFSNASALQALHQLARSKSAAPLTPLLPPMANAAALLPNSSTNRPSSVKPAPPTKSMMPLRRPAFALPTSLLSTLLDGALALLPHGGMKKPMLVIHALLTRSTMLPKRPASALLD